VAAAPRRGNAEGWKAIADGIKSPLGQWVRSFLSSPSDPLQDKRIQDYFKDEKIEDIIFVITYSGRTPQWPA
jgi:hypothetical protein